MAEVDEQDNISTDTLHFYERIGLISPVSGGKYAGELAFAHDETIMRWLFGEY